MYSMTDKAKEIKSWKVEQSLEVMDEWTRKHSNAAVYTSWGKDSVVLMHLAFLLGLTVPVVWMRFGIRDNPDCELVRDEFLKTKPMDYHEDFFDYAKVRKSGLHWKALAAKYGDYRLSGIRNDESGVRTLQWKLNGFSSEHSCRPLALWTGAEIFAYIEQNGLPLNPVYGYLGGGRWKRDRIRTHSLAGSSGDGIGRTEWEREYYLSELNRIQVLR